MKKWIAAILTLVMLSQALPWTAFAATGDMITEAELRRALQIAGLRFESEGGSSGRTLFEATSNSEYPLRLEAKESGYHEGMKPDETWDAQMLMDWLDDKLTKDIYNVTNVYTRAETILDSLKKNDPAAYARFTEGAENANHTDTCHKWAMDAELADEEARFYRQRVNEYTVVIEQNTEKLSGGADELFDHEKSRLSEQIREATQALEALRDDILTFSVAQVLIIIAGQAMIDGTGDPAFSQWLKAVLNSEDGPKEAAVPSSAVMSAGYNTRVSRMASGQRLLAADSARDVTVQVLSENDFAFVFRGVENRCVGGVKVTVSDLNGKAVKTLTSDDEFGATVFNANDFVCDYDKEMELSLTVEAEALGYRDFSIPWLTMKRGGKRTETLVLLSGPENAASASAEAGALYAAGTSAAKPYVVSCHFNGYDILRQDKSTTISKANDAKLDFELVVRHPAGMTPKAPVLYCWIESPSNYIKSVGKREYKPTRTEALDGERTKYVYTDTWKRDLSPDITVSWTDPSADQRPFFVLPDTGEVVRTTLVPVRSKVNQPIITGQETKNPLNQVMGKGFGLDVDIPGIGGKLSFGLPFEKYLPKVSCNPIGYITVIFGASGLKDPADATLWKNKEAEAYDKAMKKYQHEASVAKQKQKLGTARQYYKSVLSSKGQARMNLDFGYFLMLSGRAEKDDAGGVNWTVSGAGGGNLLFSVDYTQPMSLGPVPFYVNINFSVSAGICLEGLYFSFAFDKDENFVGMEWWVVRGVTIDIRLALTVTLGIGVKGICSVWVSATGALNVILTLTFGLPLHAAVYAEIIISVGFEIFWIKYSRAVSNIPKWKIWSNYNLDDPQNPNKKAFALFTALADTPETDKAALTPLEPERYPQLAPEAREVASHISNSRSDLKLVTAKNRTYAFYLATDSYGNRGIYYSVLGTGISGNLGYILNSIVQYSGYYSHYAYDVISDGESIVIAGTCAEQFEESGLPSTKNGKYPRFYCVRLLPSDETGMLYQEKKAFCDRQFTSLVGSIQLDEMEVFDDGNFSVSGYYERVDKARNTRDYRKFSVANTFTKVLPTPIASTSSAVGKPRTKLRTFLHRDYGQPGSYVVTRKYINGGWVALDRSDDEPENGALEVWLPGLSDDNSGIILARGEIGSYAVFQSKSATQGKYDHTFFYTQAETVGERAENRLKSVFIAPTSEGRDTEFNMVYTDYDIDIPAADFSTITIGASRYLYWLNTVTKEKETDPEVWRISGVYYDAGTGYVTDQIVIAEFSLPEVQWNGRRCKSVPVQVLLTEKGTGFIAAKPDTGDEDDHVVAPLTLYSFPITLKPVANLTGASLTETTVCQGELVAADLAVMSEGNMGIGSFDVELWLTENGREVQKIETLHADCLYPGNSTLVLHGNGRDETVAKGEAAFYRLKDFEYSPRQREWIVRSRNKTVTIRDGKEVTTADGSGEARRLVTNVLVPGALGGYTGSIKIPSDWEGRKTLRLKLVRESTYSNWLAAAALAQSRPELFAEDSVNGGRLFAADAAEDTLEKLGIRKLVYELDADGDRLVLQQPKGLFEAGASDAESDDTILLYASEIEAPGPVDINCDVHDIEVGHRLWTDYYGEAMLDIVINNYYTTREAVELTCAVYLDNAKTPRYVSLPYDQSAVSAGKTTTITLPLKTLIPDADHHKEARVVITGRNIEETAMVNNAFTLYLGGTGALTIVEQLQSVTVPVGGSALFTVRVTGGTPPYSYQWQVFVDGEWKDIPGANGDTLTLDQVKAEWNGRRTRCVITDAAGRVVVSDEAVLTVIGAAERPDTGDRTDLPLYLAVALIAAALLLRLRRRQRD